MINSVTTSMILSVFVGLLFLAYNFIVFKFSDMIFGKNRSDFARLGISLLNCAMAVAVYFSNIQNPFLLFFSVYLILFIEFMLSYKDRIDKIILIMGIYATHIKAIHAIVFSGLSWISISSAQSFMHNESSMIWTHLLTLMILLLATLLIMKVISVEEIQKVLAREEQSFFIIIWLAVCTGYLMINTQLNEYESTLLLIYQERLFACIMILCGIYIMIFFSIKNCTLLEIRIENQNLKAELENQESYRQALTNYSKFYFEANLTKNLIIKGFNDYQFILEKTNAVYTKTLPELCKILVHPDDCDMAIKHAALGVLMREYRKKNLRHTFECRVRDHDEEYYWTEFIISLIKDRKSGDIMALAYFIDIDSDKRAVMKLRDRAEKDSLTGLYNKMATESKIVDSLSLGRGMLFIIDVDNFKAVNDYCGHVRGDEILKLYAVELKNAFRPGDIVGRIGGDEFMVFLPMEYNEDCAIQKSEDILKRFYKQFSDSAGNLHIISASIGITSVTSSSMTFLGLYKQADAALYYSKGHGKNTFHIYREGEISDFVSYISSDRS